MFYDPAQIPILKMHLWFSKCILGTPRMLLVMTITTQFDVI